MKEVFRAGMSREPDGNVTVRVQKLPVKLSFPLSHCIIATLHCSVMRLADGTQI